MRMLVIIFGTLMVIVGAINLGKATSSGVGEEVVPAFNYADATVAEREVWLQTHSEPMERSVQRAFGTNRTTVSNMSYGETKISVGSRQIQYIVKLSKWIEGPLPHDFGQPIKDRLCVKYMKSPLSDNDVRMTVKVMRDNGSQAFAATYSTGVCKSYAELTTG